jgi:hypothetical protein
VHDQVELVGDPRVEVVRLPLGLGPVDDADGAPETPAAQSGRLEEEPCDGTFVEERLPAFGEGGPDVLPLGGSPGGW